MKSSALTALIATAALAGFGCGKSSQGPGSSKVVTTESPAYQSAKAQEDKYIRDAKEAERKALHRRAEGVNDH